jgi:hypothetical protein
MLKITTLMMRRKGNRSDCEASFLQRVTVGIAAPRRRVMDRIWIDTICNRLSLARSALECGGDPKARDMIARIKTMNGEIGWRGYPDSAQRMLGDMLRDG